MIGWASTFYPALRCYVSSVFFFFVFCFVLNIFYYVVWYLIVVMSSPTTGLNFLEGLGRSIAELGIYLLCWVKYVIYLYIYSLWVACEKALSLSY